MKNYKTCEKCGNERSVILTHDEYECLQCMHCTGDSMTFHHINCGGERLNVVKDEAVLDSKFQTLNPVARTSISKCNKCGRESGESMMPAMLITDSTKPGTIKVAYLSPFEVKSLNLLDQPGFRYYMKWHG